MANILVGYHMLKLTCCMNSLSIVEYLKKFFREVVNGCKNYDNMLSMTIEFSNNKN